MAGPRITRIRRMQRRGMTKNDILDYFNGPFNRRDVTRQMLEEMGYNERHIQGILRNQRRLNAQGPRVDRTPPYEKPANPEDAVIPGDIPPQEDVVQDWLSAYELFGNVLESWGIPMGNDIEAIIKRAAIDGITPDQMQLILPDIQQTNTFKHRFPGFHQRVNNGYNQLNVGEYLQLEDQYHRIMQEAGLPAGFYDDPSDFGNWIANDVSPDEIQGRVSKAMDAVRQVDPTARDLLTKFYGVTAGDLAAYFLDQKRALPTLERQWKAVNVAQWAAKNGLQVQGAGHYEDLVDKGVTAEMAAQGYGTVAAFNDAFGKLGGIYGESYTQADAENDVFFNQNDKRRKLMAKEAATFSGSSRGSTGQARRDTAY